MRPFNFFALPSLALASLKTITLITTGGTIAGVETPGTDGYISGVLTAGELLAPLADRLAHVRIREVEFANVGSHEFTTDLTLRLASVVLSAQEDPTVHGVVLVLGSDFGAALAYAVHLLIAPKIPIVSTVSYRPSTALSADGWANMLDAINVAASNGSAGRGGLLVENGNIHSVVYAQKAHTTNPGGFRSAGPGPVGHVRDSQVRYFFEASRPLDGIDASLRTPRPETMPTVEIVTAHTDMKPGWVVSFVQSTGAQGLVLVGMGAGSWPPATVHEIEGIMRDGRVVVAMARPTFEGPVPKPDVGLSCGFLDAQKCRIQLQILIANGYGGGQIEGIFRAQGQSISRSTTRPERQLLASACGAWSAAMDQYHSLWSRASCVLPRTLSWASPCRGGSCTE